MRFSIWRQNPASTRETTQFCTTREARVSCLASVPEITFAGLGDVPLDLAAVGHEACQRATVGNAWPIDLKRSLSGAISHCSFQSDDSEHKSGAFYYKEQCELMLLM